MKSTKNLILSLLISSIVLACQTQLDDKAGQAQANTTSTFKLNCVPIEGKTQEDVYRYTIFIEDGAHSQPLMIIPSCVFIDSSSYANYQVPTEAIAAVSSWWAGSGDFVYAIETKAGILFRRAAIDEMQLVKDYGYMDWALWQKDSLILYDPIDMMPVSGLYLAGGHDISYLLLLDKVEGEWQAEALELDGMLPPREDLRMELEDMNLQLIPDFELEVESGRFSAGDWGEGELIKEEGRYVLLFHDKQDLAGNPLKLLSSMR